MVGLRPFLPAGGHGALDGGVGFLYEIDKLRVQIVGAGGFRIEAEAVVKFFKHVPDDGLFVLHGEHPDAEILGLVLFPELLTGEPQQRETDLIPVDFMVLLCQRHSLGVEETGIGHLNRGFEPVFVGALLLGAENVQALGQKRLAPQILGLAVPGDLLGILRHHLRAMDDVENELIHIAALPPDD